MDRLVVVPVEKFEPLVLSLKARLIALADEVVAENITELIGEPLRLLPTIAGVDAKQELLLWARSGGAFVVAWTSRPVDADVAGVATSDREHGLVSQVFASGVPAAQAAVNLQTADWTNLEQTRGQAVAGMAASPVAIFGKSVAVLTVVAYLEEQEQLKTWHESLGPVTDAASLLGHLIEDHLLRASLGIDML